MEKRKLIGRFGTHPSVLKENAKEKAKESISAVLPIVLIVLALGFTIAALSPSILVEFLIGSVLVIIGMIFFSMGAEMSMTPMGEHVGGSMLRTKKLGFIVILGFVLGFIITISEPDLQVLAEQVSSVPNLVLILSVALGVGVTQASASLGMFPAWVTTVFGKTPVVIATVTAVFLNLVLPKEKKTEK